MSICIPEALTMPELSCSPSIGGVKSISIGSTVQTDEQGEPLDPRDPDNWDYEEFDSMPEASNYSSSYSYDKSTNVGIWTTTVTLVFGTYTPETKTMLDKLHYKLGRPITLTTEDGYVVIVPQAVWTGGEINPGTAKTDGQTGNIILTAIHKNPLVVREA